MKPILSLALLAILVLQFAQAGKRLLLVGDFHSIQAKWVSNNWTGVFNRPELSIANENNDES